MKRTHLLAPDVPVSNPFPELRPPIFQHVSFRVFDTFAVPEASLSAGGGDHVDRVKIDFQPLAWFRRDLQLRAPGASVALLPQPVRVNIYSGITVVYFFALPPSSSVALSLSGENLFLTASARKSGTANRFLGTDTLQTRQARILF